MPHQLLIGIRNHLPIVAVLGHHKANAKRTRAENCSKPSSVIAVLWTSGSTPLSTRRAIPKRLFAFLFGQGANGHGCTGFQHGSSSPNEQHHEPNNMVIFRAPESDCSTTSRPRAVEVNSALMIGALQTHDFANSHVGLIGGSPCQQASPITIFAAVV